MAETWCTVMGYNFYPMSEVAKAACIACVEGHNTLLHQKLLVTVADMPEKDHNIRSAEKS